MLNKLILVFFGGAIGAAIREFLMLSVGHFSDGFPTAMFLANLVAAFLIGLVYSLARQGGPISDEVKAFLTTGLTGGLSTFSSLMWGTLSLAKNPLTLRVGVAHLVLSLFLGFLLVEAGLKLGAVMRRKSVT